MPLTREPGPAAVGLEHGLWQRWEDVAFGCDAARPARRECLHVACSALRDNCPMRTVLHGPALDPYLCRHLSLLCPRRSLLMGPRSPA